ncbi:hypothetical protein FKW77_002185 [Venturia effusa]|uniref:Uncharacterized protein n=1 Tax=Venturia effusa TaxID=50376 RepID=A0A517LEY8_9PEZI|nr:hypothetical protein FKW77_002185 [Venturia effusa]
MTTEHDTDSTPETSNDEDCSEAKDSADQSPQEQPPHNFTSFLNSSVTNMEDFMTVVTGWKKDEPALAKRAALVSEDEDSDVEEIPRSPRWLSLHVAASASTNSPADGGPLRRKSQLPKSSTFKKAKTATKSSGSQGIDLDRKHHRPTQNIRKAAPKEKITQSSARQPWKWSKKKTTDLYVPVMQDKWWSSSESELRQLPIGRQRYMSHIARIMETELGEQLVGTNRCNNCKRHNRQCYIYSEAGRTQIMHPGVRCAACRFHDRDLEECCSLNVKKE